MRMIDADELFKFIQKERAWKQSTIKYPRYDQGKHDAFYEMLEVIKNQPTIDIPVPVKCGKCKYFQLHPNDDFCNNAGICKKHSKYCDFDKCEMCVFDTDFCSYGERKDGEEK
jgi:hypothetical protein